MLKQLLKYEFRATGRVYGGLYLALVLLSVVLGLSVRGQTVLPSNPSVWQFTVILFVVYAAVIVAIVVLCFVNTFQRFNKNLLGREGYLMHTLPVTETQLILSKLITSMLWVVCSLLVAVVSITAMVGIGAFDAETFHVFLNWDNWKEVWNLLLGRGVDPWSVLFWTILINLARLADLILCIYAACMIAHLFKKYTTVAGILAFIGLNFVENQLDQLLGIDKVNMFVDISFRAVGVDTVEGPGVAGYLMTGNPNIYYLFCFAATAAVAVCYFFLTRWLMKNKLDLE